MTMILHGASLSPFVRKVRVVLAEKSLEYDHDPVIPFGVSEEFKKKSPLGKIPCLEDGDTVLPDSSCIAAYLERLQPKPALYPADAGEYGRALWYEEYGDTKLVEVLLPVFFERFVKRVVLGQSPDEERVEKAIAESQPPVFDYLESEVTGRGTLVGAHFSIADIGIASPFVNLELVGGSVDPARWPALVDYLQGIHSRPSFKACIEQDKAGAQAPA